MFHSQSLPIKATSYVNPCCRSQMVVSGNFLRIGISTFNRINEVVTGPATRIVKAISPSGVKEPNVLSTPNSSSLSLQAPPPPVPALRIVKRTKVIPRMSSSTETTNGYRRKSSVPDVAIVTIPRSTLRQSPPELGSRLIGKKHDDEPQPIKEVKRTNPLSSFNTGPTPGDGPRRVLISEGPKFNPSTRTVKQARSLLTDSGPRRVVTTNPVIERVTKPILQASSRLKQPGKHAMVGATSIPKPITRAPGSRLPAAQGSRQRLGVFPGRTGD